MALWRRGSEYLVLVWSRGRAAACGTAFERLASESTVAVRFGQRIGAVRFEISINIFLLAYGFYPRPPRRLRRDGVLVG